MQKNFQLAVTTNVCKLELNSTSQLAGEETTRVCSFHPETQGNHLTAVEPIRAHCPQAGKVMYITQVTLGRAESDSCMSSNILCHQLASEADHEMIRNRYLFILIFSQSFSLCSRHKILAYLKKKVSVTL